MCRSLELTFWIHVFGSSKCHAANELVAAAAAAAAAARQRFDLFGQTQLKSECKIE